MYRIIILGVLFFYSPLFFAHNQQVFAQNQQAEEVLGRLRSRVEAMGGAYRVEYTVEVEGAPEVKGWYVVEGNSYRLVVPGVEVLCDGRTKWEIYHANREVMVDSVDPAQRSILTNPTRAFEFSTNEFESSYAGVRAISKEDCDIVRLTPRDRKNVSYTIELAVSRKTNLPREVVYAESEEGGEVNIRVDSFVRSSSSESSSMVFDRRKYPGFEIVDFR